MVEWFARRRIGDMPAEAARRWPEREALVFEDRRWSYRAFEDEVRRHARALVDAGIGPGDHVALWLTSRPEFLFLFFAVIRLGAVAVPLNTRYRRNELAHVLAHADCTALIMMPRSGPVDFAEMAVEVLGPSARGFAAKGFPRLRRLILTAPDARCPDAALLPDLLPAEPVDMPCPEVDPDGLALICHTAGSTGMPKGAMLTHRVIRLGIDRCLALGNTCNDVHLNFLPLFHSYGLLVVFFHSMLTGGRQVLMERFDPLEALRLIAGEGVTTLHGFDTHYRDLIAQADLHPEHDLSSLRFAQFPAGPENMAETIAAINARLCPTVSCYGTTETGTSVTATPRDAVLDQRVRASGYPSADVEIRIVDPQTGADCPPGTDGEILVRYYGLMTGYYGQPEATREVLDPEGWYHSGDMGHLRADGHLRFVGRYKDMIKVGGESVSPVEIEQLILELDAVQEAAVVAAPDPRLQEVPVVFVVPAAGKMLDITHIKGHCAGRIASYKIPQQLFTLSDLPRTTEGKVHKQALRDSLMKGRGG